MKVAPGAQPLSVEGSDGGECESCCRLRDRVRRARRTRAEGCSRQVATLRGEIVKPTDITYIRSGDGEIAYQVMGDGPIDLLIIGYVYTMESHLDEPRLARFVHGLASFSRVIRFDRRGVGLSDPFSLDAPPTLEQGAQDALMVLDAVGSEKAALMTDAGTSHVAVLLAASHPSRVSDLVLVHPYARGRRDHDYRWGYDDEQAERAIEDAARNIREPTFDTGWGPSTSDDAAMMEWRARWGRRATSPSTARALMRVTLDSDVRPLLSALRARTLVITRRDARAALRGMSEEFAQRIQGARVVEVPGDSPIPWTHHTPRCSKRSRSFSLVRNRP